jgi:hypothetical protein
MKRAGSIIVSAICFGITASLLAEIIGTNPPALPLTAERISALFGTLHPPVGGGSNLPSNGKERARRQEADYPVGNAQCERHRAGQASGLVKVP